MKLCEVGIIFVMGIFEVIMYLLLMLRGECGFKWLYWLCEYIG